MHLQRIEMRRANNWKENFSFFKEKLAVFEMFSKGQLPVLLSLAAPMILMILLHMEPAIFSKKSTIIKIILSIMIFFANNAFFVFIYLFSFAPQKTARRGRTAKQLVLLFAPT